VDDTEQHPVRSTHHPSVSCAPPEARPSDAERAAVSDALQAHCADGRLKVEELEERLAAALTASTVGELERLVKDFPAGALFPFQIPATHLARSRRGRRVCAASVSATSCTPTARGPSAMRSRTYSR
jgi:hypothetical protein